MTARQIDSRRIALIGFGEVGQRFGREFRETGCFDVATYDLLFNQSPEGAALRDKARAMQWRRVLDRLIERIDRKVKDPA